MRRLVTIVAIVVFMLAVMTPLAMAACSVGHTSSAQEGSEEVTQEATLDNLRVINHTCPVMGGEVGKDTEYTVEYDGKVIGLCCAGCVEKFNEDPEKYIQELGLEETQE
ncbi:YHS domain-containing protein [Candidatus Omnitrophota bacterium]